MMQLEDWVSPKSASGIASAIASAGTEMPDVLSCNTDVRRELPVSSGDFHRPKSDQRDGGDDFDELLPE